MLENLQQPVHVGRRADGRAGCGLPRIRSTSRTARLLLRDLRRGGSLSPTRRTPICSATDMNRLLKISSIRVDLGSRAGARRPRRDTGEQKVIQLGHSAASQAAPPWSQSLPRQGGTADTLPLSSSRRLTSGTSRHGAACVHPDGGSAAGAVFAIGSGPLRTCQMLRCRGQLDRGRPRPLRPVAHEKGEVLPVRCLEVADHAGRRPERNRQGGIGALVLRWTRRTIAAGSGRRPAVRVRPAPPRPGHRRSSRATAAGRGSSGASTVVSRIAVDVGKAEPSAESTPAAVDEHPGQAEDVGDRAGVLASGPAKVASTLLGSVVAALDRDLLDRVCHVRHGRCRRARGDLLGGGIAARRFPDLRGQRPELSRQRSRRQWLVAVRPEHLWEVRGLDPPSMTLASVTVGAATR